MCNDARAPGLTLAYVSPDLWSLAFPHSAHVHGYVARPGGSRQRQLLGIAPAAQTNALACRLERATRRCGCSDASARERMVDAPNQSFVTTSLDPRVCSAVLVLVHMQPNMQTRGRVCAAGACSPIRSRGPESAQAGARPSSAVLLKLVSRRGLPTRPCKAGPQPNNPHTRQGLGKHKQAAWRGWLARKQLGWPCRQEARGGEGATRPVQSLRPVPRSHAAPPRAMADRWLGRGGSRHLDDRRRYP
jgi:hypothetical protein